MLYLCRVKPLRHYLRGFLIAAWAGDKIAEFSFPEISFHFSLRPWFFFVSPAYAGKRACTPCCTPVCGDHPRMCGEKHPQGLGQHFVRGSPPRMRGKVCHAPHAGLKVGITPAYAGKRERGSHSPSPSWDHPRMCGEKLWLFCCVSLPSGSPPHVRGKVRLVVGLVVGGGITPACAGKSGYRSFVPARPWDHPRMCGEKTKKIP